MASIPIEDIREWLECARFGELDSVVYILSKVYPHLKKELIFSADSTTGNTALHMSAANNHTKNIEETSEKLALLSKQNFSGNTPLHWAVINGHMDVLYALLQKEPILIEAEHQSTIFDTILNLKNAAGRSPLDEAQLLGKDEIAGILLKFST